MAICPDVKMNPFALIACEYGPIAWGASFVDITSFIMPPTAVLSSPFSVEEFPIVDGRAAE
jgi:hypothetical protein